MIALLLDVGAVATSAINPMLVYLLISATVGGLIYLWRKVSLKSWDYVTRHNPRIQALPALVLSALVTAAPAVRDWKGIGSVVQDVLIGVVMGGIAIGTHHLLKAAPIPYQGGKPKDPTPGA